MAKWIRKYLILTICYAVAFAPLFLTFITTGMYNNETFRLVFWIIFPIVTVLYYGILSYFMIKGNKK